MSFEPDMHADNNIDNNTEQSELALMSYEQPTHATISSNPYICTEHELKTDGVFDWLADFLGWNWRGNLAAQGAGGKTKGYSKSNEVYQEQQHKNRTNAAKATLKKQQQREKYAISTEDEKIRTFVIWFETALDNSTGYYAYKKLKHTKDNIKADKYAFDCECFGKWKRNKRIRASKYLAGNLDLVPGQCSEAYIEMSGIKYNTKAWQIDKIKKCDHKKAQVLAWYEAWKRHEVLFVCDEFVALPTKEVVRMYKGDEDWGKSCDDYKDAILHQKNLINAQGHLKLNYGVYKQNSSVKNVEFVTDAKKVESVGFRLRDWTVLSGGEHGIARKKSAAYYWMQKVRMTWNAREAYMKEKKIDKYKQQFQKRIDTYKKQFEMEGIQESDEDEKGLEDAEENNSEDEHEIDSDKNSGSDSDESETSAPSAPPSSVPHLVHGKVHRGVLVHEEHPKPKQDYFGWIDNLKGG